MTSIIRNLKNERKANKYGFKREGSILCTQEATESEPAIMTKFPMDIGIIKRASNAKLINSRLKKAQQEFFDKYHNPNAGKHTGIASGNYGRVMVTRTKGK